MFLPTTLSEVRALGWAALDIILVTGDSYIDSPLIGTALLGKLLLREGFKVGIIAQPGVSDLKDIARLGQPALFWGVTAGSLDSMVANYTSTKKRRRSDDYTPGGINNRRPDRACIVYSNLIRRFSKTMASANPPPIVLGGIEASLRRIAHYDFWSDEIRRSILFDSRADCLLYGMAEKSVLGLAKHLRDWGGLPHELPGLCYVSGSVPQGAALLPSFEDTAAKKDAFIEMFEMFYANNDPKTARRLCQKHGDKFLIQNPPQPYESQKELDAFYDLEFERAQHPYYEKLGKVKALDTIRFSIPTHRGCYGECNFCSIALHEGRSIRWRSSASILKEAGKMAKHPRFKGIIQDLSGPTANMYGFDCGLKMKRGSCSNRRCLFPEKCSHLKANHKPHAELLSQLRKVEGVRKVFVCSGIRFDLLPHDEAFGDQYLRLLCQHHVSGQLKLAPEHSVGSILELMGKPDLRSLIQFKSKFDRFSKEAGKKQFLTYYFIAAHPGCSEEHMKQLAKYVKSELKINPEQVQIFTPTPSTWSSVMYAIGENPWSRAKLFVERTEKGKQRQKNAVSGTGA